MLFRPNFCSNCGVKVERPEWFLWTSRRFCMVCEVEFKGREMIPRAVVLVGIIVGLFGLGSYLSTGDKKSEIVTLKQQSRTQERPAELKQNNSDDTTRLIPHLANRVVSEQREPGNLSSTTGINPPPQQARQKIEREESMNFCGAETKKGTPCSRRVKGNVRCYQHIGMPSMTVSPGRDSRGQK